MKQVDIKKEDYEAKAKKVSFSTNSPDHRKVVELIDRLYDMKELPAPKEHVYCESPADFDRQVKSRGGEPAYHFGGSFDAGFIYRMQYEKTQGDVDVHEETWLRNEIYADLADEVGHCGFYEDAAFYTRKPVAVRLDSAMRLHCTTGAAVEYADGAGAYYIDGVLVGKKIVMTPQHMTIDELRTIDNEEIKSIAINRYGPELYINNAGLELLDSDPARGDLYRDGKQYVCIVTNASPEPDGTFQKFYLTLPADESGPTAQAFVARSFGLPAEFYNPQIET